MTTCAFEPCARVDECSLIGGCPTLRGFRQAPLRTSLKPLEEEGLKVGAMAVNGTKPREVRDPRFVPRKRKAIQK